MSGKRREEEMDATQLVNMLYYHTHNTVPRYITM